MVKILSFKKCKKSCYASVLIQNLKEILVFSNNNSFKIFNIVNVTNNFTRNPFTIQTKWYWYKKIFIRHLYISNNRCYNSFQHEVNRHNKFRLKTLILLIAFLAGKSLGWNLILMDLLWTISKWMDWNSIHIK